MSQVLCFNEFTFSTILRNNQPWFRSSELARALGYKREDILSKLYRKNADEFTSDMTQVIENVAQHQNGVLGNLSDGRCRIFSLRGCHLLAMFARTPVAKAFRKWVLDVIEQYGEQVPVEQPVLVNPTSTITASHQAQLKAIVDAKVGMLPSDVQRKAYAEIWSRFSRHFQIARYQQLPSERVGEAITYLIDMQLKKKRELPMPTPIPQLPSRIDEAPFLEFIKEVEVAHKEVDHIISSLQDRICDLCYSVGNALEKQADIRISFVKGMDVTNSLTGYLCHTMLSGVKKAMVFPDEHLDSYANPGYSLLGIVRQLNSARK